MTPAVSRVAISPEVWTSLYFEGRLTCKSDVEVLWVKF